MEGFTLTFDEDYERDDQSSLRIKHIMRKYEVLALAWALAGNFEVTYQAEQVDMASWQQTQTYVRVLREKSEHLLDSHQEESITRYILSVEEQLRGFAVQFTRQTQSIPWGFALEKAVKENKDLWNEFKNILQPKSGRQTSDLDYEDLPVRTPTQVPSREPQSPGGKSSGGKSSGGKGGKVSEKGNKKMATAQQSSAPGTANMAATSTHTTAGVQICKSWNDSRGCSKPCSQGRVHCCDIVLLKSGAVCGRSDHNRRAHNPMTHGASAHRV